MIALFVLLWWMMIRALLPPTPGSQRLTRAEAKSLAAEISALLQESAKTMGDMAEAHEELLAAQQGLRDEVRRLQDSLEHECRDVDALLKRLGLDPETCRTDAGWLNATKIDAQLEAQRVAREAEAEKELLQVIGERDDYHEWADKLAEAIAQLTGAWIGEHTSANSPWQNALDSQQRVSSFPRIEVFTGPRPESPYAQPQVTP